jgi:Dyp-type peroxidase family
VLAAANDNVAKEPYMPPLTPDQERNIQGVALAGFRKDFQQLMFVRFAAAASGRRLLTALNMRVASLFEVGAFNAAFSEILHRSGREDVIEATWVGLMISAHGYTKLGVNMSELPAGPGSDAFVAGMAARAEQIGHTRANDAPAGWIPEFRPGAGVDALIVVASDETDDLDERVVEIENLVSQCGCEIAYQEASAVLPGPLKGHEHFGFKDGVSQPTIADLDPAPAPNEPPAVALGEFVLGYPDETGQAAAVGSLWQYGSFAAFERITQDVHAFRQQASDATAATSPALTAEQMAAKMVGRWPSGTPLETAPDGDPGDSGITNAFEYQAAPFNDDDGSKTPRFAHVRKANPRDETRPDPNDSVQRHRMIRRGTPFGAPLAADASQDDGGVRGLHFLCFVADLARQFEFVQSRWLNDPNFPSGGAPSQPGGPYAPPQPGTPPDGPDPVVGEHDAGAQCALHESSGVHAVTLGSEVVSVTAGEYFFAPSIRALEQLASGATSSQ